MVTELAIFEMVEMENGRVYFRCGVGGYSYSNDSLPELIKEVMESQAIQFTLANINLDRLGK